MSNGNSAGAEWLICLGNDRDGKTEAEEREKLGGQILPHLERRRNEVASSWQRCF